MKTSLRTGNYNQPPGADYHCRFSIFKNGSDFGVELAAVVGRLKYYLVTVHPGSINARILL